MKRIELILKSDNPREELAKFLDDACKASGTCGGSCGKCVADLLLTEVKTLADVFFERNPNAPKSPRGCPFGCPRDAGLFPYDCKSNGCRECWTRPYVRELTEEERNGIDARD